MGLGVRVIHLMQQAFFSCFGCKTESIITNSLKGSCVWMAAVWGVLNSDCFTLNGFHVVVLRPVGERDVHWVRCLVVPSDITIAV